MKKNTHKLALITILVILYGCEGKQGDPGPAGAAGAAGTNGAAGATGATGATGAAGPNPLAPFVNGSFSGTITGTRKDGTTPINETFSYTYAFNTEGFSAPVGGTQTLSLFRNLDFGGSVNMRLSLQIKNKDLATQAVTLNDRESWLNYFSFTKALTGNQAFVLEAQPILKSYALIYPVDPANTTYSFQFVYDFYSENTNAYLRTEGKNINGEYVFGFKTKNGENVYYRQAFYGGQFVQIENADGTISTTSATYGSIRVGNDNTSGSLIFYKGEQNLSKAVTVPADTYTLSNYTYDKTTGNLSFGFTIDFGGYPKPNTTTNPLKVTGTFTGKVFETIVNRKGNTDETTAPDH